VKEAIFHNKAIEILRTLSGNTRQEIGKAIRDLQRGLTLGMPLSRPMPSVGIGVAEIRVRDEHGITRTFYYSKSKRGILVFHVFVKKTQKTPAHEIELAKRRLREMLYEKTN
jgi:phage-related protein